jgi:hypothetical protein
MYGKPQQRGTRFRETIMFNFDISDIQRITVAAVGALILASTFVGAAVAPARAVETSPAVHLQA